MIMSPDTHFDLQAGVSSQVQSHSRHKRSWGSVFMVAQGTAVAAGTIATGLSIGDYLSDGAMYYPSINDAKRDIRRHEGELRDLEPQVKQKIKDLRVKRDAFISARDSFKGWGKLVKIIDRLEARLKRSGQLVDSATFLTGIDVASPDPLNWDKTVGQDAMFYTGIGLSAMGNVMAIGHFVHAFRQAAAMKAEAMPYYIAALKYHETLPPQKQALVGEFIGPSTRENLKTVFKQHLQTRMGKAMFAFAVLSTCLIIVNVGLSVHFAKVKRDNLVLRKNKISSVVADTNEALRNATQLINDMDADLTIYADATTNFMRAQGFDCNIDSTNVASTLSTLQRVWSELSVMLTRTSTAKKFVKRAFNRAWRYARGNAALVYEEMMDEEFGYPEYLNAIVELLREKDVDLGQWGEYQPVGQCYKECGTYMRAARRTCIRGPCYGSDETLVPCNVDEDVDKDELLACVEDPKSEQHKSAVARLRMEQLLPETCSVMH